MWSELTEVRSRDLSAILFVIIVFGLILLLLASGMWISGALGIIGVILLFGFVGGGREGLFGILQFNTVNIFTYTCFPLFLFMGEMIYYSGLSEKVYRGATKLVGFIPGGLLHTNIASCAVFAAVSGSSMATAATIGTVAVPELEKRGYNRRLLYGSLAAGGTLGILIPPSIPMIIYGAWVEESIGKLFIAGVFPGLILAGLFMTYIAFVSILRPHLVAERLKFSFRAIASAVLDMWPIVVLIFLVLGTIYLGVATPTESASLGALGAVIFCALYRRLTWETFKKSAVGAIKITSWALLIVIGAQVLSRGLSFLRVPAQLANWVASLPVDKFIILGIIVIMYIILGCFMEAMSMMLLTLPVIYPVIVALGFDTIWFGVMMVVFIEMGQITPPVGVNLYVLHGITGKRHLNDIIMGIIPFFFAQLVLIILLVAFPSLATWLPAQMIKRRF